jgi:hypothetical protein
MISPRRSFPSFQAKTGPGCRASLCFAQVIWRKDMQRSLLLGMALAAVLGAPAGAGPNAPTKIHKVAPPGIAPATFTAVVTANGTLKRGVGAVSASIPEGKGTYEVDFTNDVTACAYVVTIGEPDSSGSQPAAAATVVGRSGTPNGIFIDVFDATGAPQKLPFHVDVGC